MNAKTIQTENRRLMLLTILSDDTDYSTNDKLLQKILASQGDNVPLDLVRTELAWLEEQSLLVQHEVPGCIISTLTGRGLDAAKGLLQMPGLARPRPE